MVQTSHSGFTLIELAVAIAIIAILASIALTRLAGLVGGAEFALATNFGKTLNSSSSTFIAQHGHAPASYTDFVTTDPANVTTGSFTVALPVNPKGEALCQPPSGSQLVCDNFETITATYTLAGGITQTSIVDK